MTINWYAVEVAAFTAIRFEMSVATLQRLHAEGDDTPASGDALAQARVALKRTR